MDSGNRFWDSLRRERKTTLNAGLAPCKGYLHLVRHTDAKFDAAVLF
jgi:hypothetical protein